MTDPSSAAKVCRVFFSYARKDGKWLLEPLVRQIEELARNEGIEFVPWIDTGSDEDQRRNIEHGEDFWKKIQHAIDGCHFAVFILSPNSVGFDRYCLRELNYAQAERKPILPVVARNDYRQILDSARLDFETVKAVRELERIDFPDFSPCWSKTPIDGFADEPPTASDLAASDPFRNGWNRLKPQIANGLRGEPFSFRDLRIAQAAKEARRSFLPDDSYFLQPRSAVWDKIREVSEAGRGTIVHGEPGIGKTRLMQWVTRQEPERVIATWRCVREFPATWDVVAFTRSVVLQIAAALPEYRDQVDLGNPAFAAMFHRNLVVGDAAAAFRDAAIVPLRALKNPPASPLYLLVDGLDEAPDFADDRMTIPTFLRKHHNDLPPWLRVVATGQSHYVASEQRFARWRSVDLDKQENGHAQDLRAYVRSAFATPAFDAMFLTTGVDVEETTDAAIKTAEGNFLVAFWLIEAIDGAWRKANEHGESARSRFASDLRHAVKTPPSIDDYVANRLQRAFETDPTAWPQAARFLAALSVAKRSLDESELCALAGLNPEELGEVRRRVGFLLKSVAADGSRGGTLIDFFHNGVRGWLPTSGPYGVSRCAGHEAVANAIETDLGGEDRQLRVPYLRDFGLKHLLAVDRVDLAVRVLGILRLDDEVDASLELKQTLKNVFAAIETLWHRDSPVVKKIDIDRLVKVMLWGCGEIPAFYGPCRILFDSHTGEWANVGQALVDSDDLLVRHVLARAIADSYLDRRATPSHRATLWNEIVASFEAIESSSNDGAAEESRLSDEEKESAYNLRQWARYAWRFLAPQEGAGPEVDAFLPQAIATLSASEDYNDHMILWECLLEGAMTGRLHPGADGKLPLDAFDERFRVPRWPYLRLDMLEFAAQCELLGESAMEWLGDTPDLRLEVDVVLRRLDQAEGDRERLKKKYANSTALHDESRKLLISPLKLWDSPADLNRAIRRTTEALTQLDDQAIAEYLGPFVLHPCWDVAESASSVAARLLEYHADLHAMVAEWSKSEFWQARYIAADAAYNARATLVGDDAVKAYATLTADPKLLEALHRTPSGEAAFAVMTDALHDDPVSRVQFLVAENLFYLLGDHEEQFENDPLPKPHQYERHAFRMKVSEYEKALRHWLGSADDCTLLDELSQFVRELMRGKRAGETKASPAYKATQPLIRAWLEGEVSKYLAVHPEWWKLDRETWLKRMSAVRESDLARTSAESQEA